MIGYKYFGYVFLLTCFIACGTNTSAETGVEQITEDVTINDTIVENSADSVLINRVYDKFVFAIDAEGNDNPTDYFTTNALKKLQHDYEFDCDRGPCYAYYALRTQEQDSKPNSEDVSNIRRIESIGDGWYVVSYLDMGWSGMTRIKIVDGKIDDYERCVSDL